MKAGALAGIIAAVESLGEGLLGNFGANSFTFFAVSSRAGDVALAFLLVDNLAHEGKPFEGYAVVLPRRLCWRVSSVGAYFALRNDVIVSFLPLRQCRRAHGLPR